MFFTRNDIKNWLWMYDFGTFWWTIINWRNFYFFSLSFTNSYGGVFFKVQTEFHYFFSGSQVQYLVCHGMSWKPYIVKTLKQKTIKGAKNTGGNYWENYQQIWITWKVLLFHKTFVWFCMVIGIVEFSSRGTKLERFFA